MDINYTDYKFDVFDQQDGKWEYDKGNVITQPENNSRLKP